MSVLNTKRAPSSALDEARKILMKTKDTDEFAAVEANSYLAELQDQINNLRAGMYDAKKAAMAEAAKPFLEEIENCEKRFALYIRLST